mmetsp:Transcript_52/g.82  ORF Transcript_52/g.82 Transcript_52/m.82 type:complete len:688 (-) Transcript_52:278-2341(-)
MVVQHGPSKFSVKCLLWQYDQLMRLPLDGVNAAPLESNIFEWHGNFYFKEDHQHFPSMVVHFILTLPKDFPNSTPEMVLLNPFPHSHVIGDTICFSLLNHWQWFFNGQPNTTFWNPSRTIRSLLESVYIFLTVDEDKHITVSEYSAKSALGRAQRACCRACGHNPSQGKPWPPEEYWTASLSSSRQEQQVCALAMHDDLVTNNAEPTKKRAVAATKKVPPSLPKKAVVVEITQNTAVRVKAKSQDLDTRTEQFDTRAATLKAEAESMMASAPSALLDLGAVSLEAMEDFRCSITGVAFDHSEKAVLGFGVNVQRRPDGTILAISTDLMPISMRVFVEGKIRKSALGEKITHFFPFAINEQHWRKAKRVLPACVDAILKGSSERNLSNRPEDKLFFVVGELWKSMAVLMMKGEAHASEKVLKGFCALHHILLFATEERDIFDGSANPRGMIAKSAEEEETADLDAAWTLVTNKKNVHKTNKEAKSNVLTLANNRVKSFAKSPWARHKSKCPDFGRFLPLMLLSDLTWWEMQEPFVGELLARNAKWIAKEQPSLKTVKPYERRSVPSRRITESWGPSATGLKLTAFQIRFVLNILPWAREGLPKSVLDAYSAVVGGSRKRLLARVMYNTLGGRPTQGMLEKFQKETKAIEGMTSYEEFFETVEMKGDRVTIQHMLCNAMERSEQCHYHR